MLAGIVLGGALIASAASDGPARVSRTAERVHTGAGDVAVLFDIEEVDREVVTASFAIAENAGGSAATGRTGSAGMRRLARAGATVHSAPDGFLIPLVYLGLPRAALGGIYGPSISRVVEDDTVVLNAMTAGLMGAQAGDVLEMRAKDGATHSFRIALVVPYETIGGNELLMTIGGVERLGEMQDTRTVIWSIDSRSAFDAAAAATGMIGRTDTRVARSWDPRDPDDTLSTPRTKTLLGEPWYQVSGDTLWMHPTWMANNLTDGRILLDPNVRVRAQCHVRIVANLSAALGEVAAAGLGGQIDVTNTNTYGGCFNPRYSRLSGFLSRHAYAQAIDMNTTTNCLGCVPRMNCDVVRIFRRHGFAWGGNFRRPDGMHFEWVGEPRHQIAFPSKYCPNQVAGLGTPADPLGVDVLAIDNRFSTDSH